MTRKCYVLLGILHHKHLPMLLLS